VLWTKPLLNSTSRTIASSWLSKPTKPSGVTLQRLLAEEEAKLAALNHQPNEQKPKA
jgi:hypothetical protein